jgi:hypothetical protein
MEKMGCSPRFIDARMMSLRSARPEAHNRTARNSTARNSRELTAPGTWGNAFRGLLAPGYFLACCAIFAVCSGSRVSADAGFNAASSFSAPHPAVVRVVAPEREGVVSYGSGSLVAVDQTSGLVVTNWHVVRDAAATIVVYFPDGFHSGAHVLRVDRDWDLAALAIRRPNVQPIPLATQAPQFDDSLTIIGYGGGSYRAATGRCTQYLSPGGNFPLEMVELSAGAREGDSGGPILNGRGELAGVLFGTAFGRTTGSYCGRVRWFLASVDADFHSLSQRVMLADQARKNGAPVAATPVGLATAAPAPRETAIGNPEPNTPAPVVATSPLLPVPQRSTLPTPTAIESKTVVAAADRPADSGRSCSVPGPVASPVTTTSTGEQVKTILALVGVVAVLYHAIRLLGTAVG